MLTRLAPRGWTVIAALVLILALALGAAACGDDKGGAGVAGGEALKRGPQEPILIPPGEPIVVGVSAPLTGPDEALGTEDRDAVIVGVERWKEANGNRIRGHEIEIRAADDGCTEAEITVQAAERLLRHPGLIGVIGPNCSAGAQAAIPVYSDAGIVAISGSATESGLTRDQPPGGFFFRTAYRNDLQGTLVGLFASLALQGETAYLIDDGEPYGRDLVDAAQEAMEKNGVTVSRKSVRRGTVDFSELVTQIAQDNPTFVGFGGFNPEAALLYRQLRDAGYDGLFGSGDAAASVATFVEPVGTQAAEGVLFSGCSLTLTEDFLADFRQLHGYEPQASPFTAQQADAVTVLLDAVAKVAKEQPDGSLMIDPAALRDAVRAGSMENGISGSIAFDAYGDRVPPGVEVLSEFIDSAIESGDTDVFVELGLVPCQVQDGELVNVLGPGAQEIRLP